MARHLAAVSGGNHGRDPGPHMSLVRERDPGGPLQSAVGSASACSERSVHGCSADPELHAARGKLPDEFREVAVIWVASCLGSQESGLIRRCGVAHGDEEADRQRREWISMAERKVWLVTGAGRGLGVDIVKAALGAGHAVVATGRNPERVNSVLGVHDELLVVELDVTSTEDAGAAVEAAVDRFGRIDVLVNNAGNFYAGFFEEISPDAFRAQLETTLFGPLNVTRAVLPVMRAQRSGLVVAISSTAGIVGQEFCSAYAASKFGVEGWIESLTPEVASFGIRTMVVEPGFFRTELLTPESTEYAEPSIDDYAERTEKTVTAWKGMNGQQGGDPAKLADSLVQLAAQDEPPVRFVAGADAVATVEQKAKDLLAQVDAYRELSSNLAHDDA